VWVLGCGKTLESSLTGSHPSGGEAWEALIVATIYVFIPGTMIARSFWMESSRSLPPSPADSAPSKATHDDSREFVEPTTPRIGLRALRVLRRKARLFQGVEDQPRLEGWAKELRERPVKAQRTFQ